MGRAENFLARWSRRKRFAARARSDPEIPAQAPEAPDASGERAEDAARVAAQSLPPVEPLDGNPDITRCLAPGVPAELARRALRRAWVADPAIRDFIGLSENAWDFTAAGDVPGFGPLSAEDAARLLARTLTAGGGADTPQSGRTVAAPGQEATADPSGGDREPHRARQIAGDLQARQDFGEPEINRPADET